MSRRSRRNADQAGRAPRTASDIDTLTAQQALGWSLPVSGLRDWLQGYATGASGKRFAASPANNSVFTGRLAPALRVLADRARQPRRCRKTSLPSAAPPPPARAGDPDHRSTRFAEHASLHGCPAPAKLNLFLHVVGRRADGYHLLQSVFQLIDRGDTLHFDLRAMGRSVRTTEVPGVPEESDLIVRALRRLAAAFRTPPWPRCARHRCRRRKNPADGWRAGRRLVGCGHRADGGESPVAGRFQRRGADGHRPAAGRRHSLFYLSAAPHSSRAWGRRCSRSQGRIAGMW
jgi:hypothetical protein